MVCNIKVDVAYIALVLLLKTGSLAVVKNCALIFTARIEVQTAVRRKFEQMRGKFFKLLGTVMETLKKKIGEREIDLDTLKTHLTFRDPDNEERYKASQSVEDLMMVIRRDCFVTNPDLLESFTVEFDLPDVEEGVERYRDDLEDYYQQVQAEDFVQEGLEQYDKDANVEVCYIKVEKDRKENYNFNYMYSVLHVGLK